MPIRMAPPFGWATWAGRTRQQGLRFRGPHNNKPSTLIGVFLQPGANALDVATDVKKTLTGLSGRFPPGLTYSIPYDTTRFVEVSIREVVKTLGEAMLLVILVVYLFLQNFRATLIPMHRGAGITDRHLRRHAGAGLSPSTLLTLFGMVLAIGIVVDDAIVVLENVERIMQEKHKCSPKRGRHPRHDRRSSGPVIAIVLVLCAVFLPVAFHGRS